MRARQGGNEADDFLAVSRLHRGPVGEVLDRTAMIAQGESRAVQRHLLAARVANIHLHRLDVQQVPAGIVGMISRPGYAAAGIGDCSKRHVFLPSASCAFRRAS
jgi:hypothetical protein